MQSQITISGPGFMKSALGSNFSNMRKKSRFFHFEAFNDVNEDEELVLIYVEGDEEKIDALIQNIHTLKL